MSRRYWGMVKNERKPEVEREKLVLVQTLKEGNTELEGGMRK